MTDGIEDFDEDDIDSLIAQHLAELVFVLDERFGRHAWRIGKYRGGLLVSGPGASPIVGGAD